MQRFIASLLVLLALAACQSQEKKVPSAAVSLAQAEEAVSLKQYPKAKIAQERLHDLYNRLKSIKATDDFASKGFGAGYADGSKWNSDAMTWRDESRNGGVPLAIQDGFDAIITLASEYLDARRTPAVSPQTLNSREETQYDSRAKARAAIDLKVID